MLWTLRNVVDLGAKRASSKVDGGGVAGMEKGDGYGGRGSTEHGRES